jgi:hypothetical protein
VDDSTLDKLYAKKMEVVTRHWSGKHGRVVKGINLITRLWTEGDRHIPLDYRFHEKCIDGATKIQPLPFDAHHSDHIFSIEYLQLYSLVVRALNLCDQRSIQLPE